MWIKIKSRLFKYLLPITFSLSLVFVSIFSFYQVSTLPVSSNSYEWNSSDKEDSNSKSDDGDYIKWFEFNVSYNVLDKTSKLDINSHNNDEDVKLNWIELISYLACKYGNNFSKFKQSDLDSLVEKLNSGQTIEELTQDMKYYSYYFEGYDSVLHEFIGEYEIASTDNLQAFESKYGIKSFHPLAKGYSYESGIIEAVRLESIWWLEDWNS